MSSLAYLGSQLAHDLLEVRVRCATTLLFKIEQRLVTLDEVARSEPVLDGLVSWFDRNDYSDTEEATSVDTSLLRLVSSILGCADSGLAGESPSENTVAQASMRLVSLGMGHAMQQYLHRGAISHSSTKDLALSVLHRLAEIEPFAPRRSDKHTHSSPEDDLSNLRPDQAAVKAARGSTRTVSANRDTDVSTHSNWKWSWRFPLVSLIKKDEEAIYDTGIRLTVDQKATVREALRELLWTQLQDFPAEVFLQYPRVLHAVCNLLKCVPSRAVLESVGAGEELAGKSAASQDHLLMSAEVAEESLDVMAIRSLRLLFAQLQQSLLLCQDNSMTSAFETSMQSEVLTGSQRFSYPAPAHSNDIAPRLQMRQQLDIDRRRSLSVSQAALLTLQHAVPLLRSRDKAALLYPLLHDVVPLVFVDFDVLVAGHARECATVESTAWTESQRHAHERRQKLELQDAFVSFVEPVLALMLELASVCEFLRESPASLTDPALSTALTVAVSLASRIPSAEHTGHDLPALASSQLGAHFPRSLFDIVAEVLSQEPLGLHYPLLSEQLLHFLERFDHSTFQRIERLRKTVQSALWARQLEFSNDIRSNLSQLEIIVAGLEYVPQAIPQVLESVLTAVGRLEARESDRRQATQILSALLTLDVSSRLRQLVYQNTHTLVRSGRRDISLDFLLSPSVIHMIVSDALGLVGTDDGDSCSEVALSLLTDMCTSQWSSAPGAETMGSRTTAALSPFWLQLWLVGHTSPLAAGVADIVVRRRRVLQTAEEARNCKLQMALMGLFVANETVRAEALPTVAESALRFVLDFVGSVSGKARAEQLFDMLTIRIQSTPDPVGRWLQAGAAGRSVQSPSSNVTPDAKYFQGTDIEHLLSLCCSDVLEAEIRSSAAKQLFSLMEDDRFKPILCASNVLQSLHRQIRRDWDSDDWSDADAASEPPVLSHLKLLSVAAMADFCLPESGQDVKVRAQRGMCIRTCTPFIFHPSVRVVSCALRIISDCLFVGRTPLAVTSSGGPQVAQLCLRASSRVPAGATSRVIAQFAPAFERSSDSLCVVLEGLSDRTHLEDSAAFREAVQRALQPSSDMSASFGIVSLVTELESSHSHEHFMSKMRMLELQLLLHSRSSDDGDAFECKRQEDEALVSKPLRWVPALQRFLSAAPSSVDDDKLLMTILEALPTLLSADQSRASSTETAGEDPICFLSAVLLVLARDLLDPVNPQSADGSSLKEESRSMSAALAMLRGGSERAASHNLGSKSASEDAVRYSLMICFLRFMAWFVGKYGHPSALSVATRQKSLLRLVTSKDLMLLLVSRVSRLPEPLPLLGSEDNSTLLAASAIQSAALDCVSSCVAAAVALQCEAELQWLPKVLVPRLVSFLQTMRSQIPFGFSRKHLVIQTLQCLTHMCDLPGTPNSELFQLPLELHSAEPVTGGHGASSGWGFDWLTSLFTDRHVVVRTAAMQLALAMLSGRHTTERLPQALVQVLNQWPLSVPSTRVGLTQVTRDRDLSSDGRPVFSLPVGTTAQELQDALALGGHLVSVILNSAENEAAHQLAKDWVVGVLNSLPDSLAVAAHFPGYGSVLLDFLDAMVRLRIPHVRLDLPVGPASVDGDGKEHFLELHDAVALLISETPVLSRVLALSQQVHVVQRLQSIALNSSLRCNSPLLATWHMQNERQQQQHMRSCGQLLGMLANVFAAFSHVHGKESSVAISYIARHRDFASDCWSLLEADAAMARSASPAYADSLLRFLNTCFFDAPPVFATLIHDMTSPSVFLKSTALERSLGRMLDAEAPTSSKAHAARFLMLLQAHRQTLVDARESASLDATAYPLVYGLFAAAQSLCCQLDESHSSAANHTGTPASDIKATVFQAFCALCSQSEWCKQQSHMMEWPITRAQQLYYRIRSLKLQLGRDTNPARVASEGSDVEKWVASQLVDAAEELSLMMQVVQHSLCGPGAEHALTVMTTERQEESNASLCDMLRRAMALSTSIFAWCPNVLQHCLAAVVNVASTAARMNTGGDSSADSDIDIRITLAHASTTPGGIAKASTHPRGKQGTQTAARRVPQKTTLHLLVSLCSSNVYNASVRAVAHRALDALLVEPSGAVAELFLRTGFMRQAVRSLDSLAVRLGSDHAVDRHVSRVVESESEAVSEEEALRTLRTLVSISFAPSGGAALYSELVPQRWQLLLWLLSCSESRTSPRMVSIAEESCILFRNVCFHAAAKLPVLSNEALMEWLLDLLQSPLAGGVEAITHRHILVTSALWSLVYDNQRGKGLVKAMRTNGASVMNRILELQRFLHHENSFSQSRLSPAQIALLEKTATNVDQLVQLLHT